MAILCNTMMLAPHVYPFISSWKTDNAGTSSSTQITLPLVSAGQYNFNVQWGDGNSDNISVFNAAPVTHTYSVSGTYTVTITGMCGGWSFNNGGDCLKLLTISQWGCLEPGANVTGAWFFGCANLTISATDILNTSNATSMSSAFRSCSSISTIPNIGKWNTSKNKSLASCFAGSTIFNDNITTWDTSKVTSFNNIFAVCTSFNQGIGSWNTSSGTSFSTTFNGASAFNKDLSTWDVSHSTTFSQMFSNATNFNQNIGGWNTGAVTNMANMFNGATAFNQQLGAWNITALTNAASMFSGVTLSKTNYNQLLSGWGSQVPHTSVTFSGGSSHYDSTTGGFNGTAGRLVLTGTYSWTITDGGTP